MRYFYIEKSKLTGNPPVIAGSDAKHIRTVLRLKSGDRIRLFDNSGFNYEAQITGFRSGNVELALVRHYESTLESRLQITVAQALLKDRKMDTIIRQLTELGIKKWVPFTAERSVARVHEDRIQTRVERWKKISAESVKQCGRGTVPEISMPISFEALLDSADNNDLKILFWEGESTAKGVLLHQPEKRIDSICMILGPEGGFTSREIQSAGERGFVTASLGPRILRADTASVAACALLQYIFGDMGPAGIDKKQ
jgi:16S rRNA (uracil1498-N3)-methyltransferase